MRQVHNGRLYIRYTSSSQKNKAEKRKRITDYILLLFWISSSFSFLFLFFFFLFYSFFFLFSFPSCITQNYVVCLCEHYAYQMTALLIGIIPTCYELHVNCNWQLSYTHDTVSQMFHVPLSDTSLAFHTII